MTTVDVLDSFIHYVERGDGPPLVFLHGNPTSSRLWRKVLPALAVGGRALAPDLIGMGRSGKPDVDYTFGVHADYLAGWLDALDLRGVLFVGHDWGGALACDWAARHPDRVAGIVLMETILRPLSWADFPESAREVFRLMREPGTGEQLVLEDNLFIARALPGAVPSLSAEDLALYAEPYPTPQTRRPLLAWPRQMPLDGEPAAVVEAVERFGRWLGSSPEVPKLLLTFDPGPGIMIGPDAVGWSRAHIAGLTVTACGTASHHAPEDRPSEIAAAIGEWAVGHSLVAKVGA